MRSAVGAGLLTTARLAERAGFKVKHLWALHGGEELLKENRWTTARLKSVALGPALAAGQALGRGTTIEVLPIAV